MRSHLATLVLARLAILKEQPDWREDERSGPLATTLAKYLNIQMYASADAHSEPKIKAPSPQS